MCGFFGSFAPDGKIKNLKRNLVSLKHRGPDSDYKFYDNFFYCHFFRLDIIGGKQANQPMVSYDRNLIMVFNGEIYNYLELAKEYNISSKNGDTRVLIELFSKVGTEIIKKCNGMFAIILYDKKRKTINLIRDRLGTKPLYYNINNNIIYFASEIKAIPTIKNVEYNTIKQYIDYGKYPTIKTFFKNIYNVPASTQIVFKKNNFIKKKYFNLRKEVNKNKKDNFDKEKYKNLLNNAIKIRQRSDKKINFHLSGGIDSTALLTYTKENWSSSYELNTSSFSYANYANDEYEYISRISKTLKIKNKKTILNPTEVPSLAEKLQYFQDEPYGGLASIAEYKLNLEERNRGEIVSFEGMGGDEILGGYNSHTLLALNEIIKSKKSKNLIGSLYKYLKIKNNKERVKLTKKLIQSEFNANTDLSDFRLNEMKKGLDLNNKNWFDEIVYFDFIKSKIPRTLRFRDRISSACSRELRFPFLDHNFLTYTLSAPLEFKYEFGLPKYPLRKIVKKYFKKDFKYPKRSLSSPQTNWLQGPLRDWAHDNLNSLEKKFLIDQKYIDEALSLINHKLKNSYFIWQLINLNLFFENVKKQNNLLND